MKLKYIIITSTTMILSGCVTTTEPEVTRTNSRPINTLDLYGKKSVVTVHSDVKLLRKAVGAFNEYGKSVKGYYGAFAYSPTGPYHLTVGYNTLSLAREDALRYCSQLLKKGEEECEIIATLTPEGYTDKGKTTLSKNGTIELKKLRTKRKYFAFAMNDIGNTGFVWARKTQEFASSDALALCSQTRDYNNRWEDKVYPCYLIDLD